MIGYKYKLCSPSGSMFNINFIIYYDSNLRVNNILYITRIKRGGVTNNITFRIINISSYRCSRIYRIVIILASVLCFQHLHMVWRSDKPRGEVSSFGLMNKPFGRALATRRKDMAGGLLPWDLCPQKCTQYVLLNEHVTGFSTGLPNVTCTPERLCMRLKIPPAGLDMACIVTRDDRARLIASGVLLQNRLILQATSLPLVLLPLLDYLI